MLGELAAVRGAPDRRRALFPRVAGYAHRILGVLGQCQETIRKIADRGPERPVYDFFTLFLGGIRPFFEIGRGQPGTEVFYAFLIGFDASLEGRNSGPATRAGLRQDHGREQECCGQ